MAGTTGWKVCFKKGATWGTAVAAGAGDLIKLISESLPPGIPATIKDDNVGDSLSGGNYQGNIEEHEGAIVMAPRLEGFERHLALLMGADTVVINQAGIVFEHDMRFQPSNNGLFGTLAFDKGIGALGTNVHEYPSFKYSQLELGHEGGKLQGTLTGLFNRCERNAPVNGAAQFGAITIPKDGLIALFSALTVRATEVTGAEGNLDGADDLKVSDCRVSINRNIAGDVVSGSNGEIDEPDTNGMPTADVTLTFPQYTAAVDALIKAASIPQTGRRQKLYKAQLIWTGPTIPTSAPPLPYLMRFDFPAMTIMNAPTNAPSPGSKVPVEITFSVTTPEAGRLPNGTDWSWVTAGGAPFRAYMFNGNSVDQA